MFHCSLLQRVRLSASGLLAFALAFGLNPAPVSAQTLGEFDTAMQMNDTLSGGPVGGSNVGNLALQRAQGLQGGAPGQQGAGLDFNAAGQAAQGAVDRVIPRITVIKGTRVFDAITGQLLDEPREMQVPSSEKELYYDDGTNGDLVAGDGEYSKVEVNDEYIGPGNQRVKEQLISALQSANQMDPLQFYGLNIMSTERREAAPRNRVWKLNPDPAGGPGLILEEQETEEPLRVPKYRERQQQKDYRVKEDWSYRFLQEYRLNKDSLTSEFYKMHIPMPPVPPNTRPPNEDLWIPFNDPGSLERSIQQQFNAPGAGGGLTGGRGANPYGGGQGVTGAPVGNASSRYY